MDIHKPHVADTFNRTIRKVVIASGTVSTIAGKAEVEGGVDATGTEARFNPDCPLEKFR